MHTIKLDLQNGSVLIDSSPITIDEQNTLNKGVENMCTVPIESNEGTRIYSLREKTVVCGKSANCLIIECEKKVKSTIFLFDFIEFFASSVLESKILRSCEKSSNVKFSSDHPSVAFLKCEWGQAIFSYDARQGDLSLHIILTKMTACPV